MQPVDMAPPPLGSPPSSLGEKSPSAAGSEPELPILATPSEAAFTYTAAEERKVFWKLNFTVLPLLALGFYVFQLERGNIANALTDG
jgi:hypothetical protein